MTQPTTPETPADAGTPTPFEVGLQLRWSDEDRYGHVNNARLLTLAEEARVRALAAWATTTASRTSSASCGPWRSSTRRPWSTPGPR